MHNNTHKLFYTSLQNSTFSLTLSKWFHFAFLDIDGVVGLGDSEGGFKAEVSEANVSRNISSVTDAEKALREAVSAEPLADTVGMEGIVKDNMLKTDSAASSDTGKGREQKEKPGGRLMKLS